MAELVDAKVGLMSKVITETLKEEILKLYPDYDRVKEFDRSKDGRYRVNLYGKKLRAKCVQRGRLILEVQLGRRLVGDETVDHIDNDKGNDDPTNLQVLSRSENASKGAIGNKRSLGYKQSDEHKRVGGKNGKAKLTDEVVEALRQQFARNELSKSEIIDRTGMSDKGVRNMLFGVTYPNVGHVVIPNRPGRPPTA